MSTNNLYLLRQLSQRDFAHRYKGTVGGILWVVVQPLFMLAIYTVVFGLIFKPRWSGLDSVWDYALVIFLGKIPYIFMLETVGRSPALISSHLSYVKKLTFPLHLLPWMSHITAALVAGISLLVWLVFAIAIHHRFPVEIFLVPIIYVPMFISLLGISYVLSSLGAYFKDVGNVIQPILFAMMFMSPVFYPLDMVPPKIKALMVLNPLVYPIEQSRSLLLFSGKFELIPYLVQLATGLVVLVVGWLWFNRTREGFAEVL